LPKVKFNLEYRKTKGAFQKPNAQQEETFWKKISYFQKMELSDFLQGSAKPRLWKGDPPDNPPQDLSKDIIDTGLYRINFNRKMRIFAYRKDEIFFIRSVDTKHKSG
jgi:hypothetical protein